MPRVHRHSIPGYVWHITQRCHKREFFLKFASDRRRRTEWLFEARERFGLIMPVLWRNPASGPIASIMKYGIRRRDIES